MNAKPQVRGNLRASPLAGPGERFRLLAEHAPVMLWLSDSEGESIYFNPAWLAFRHRRLEEETGAGWLEGLHPEDRERVWSRWMDAVATRTPFRNEFRMLRADGQYRRVRVSAAPVYDGKRFAGFAGSCIDVTDEIAAQVRDQEQAAGELERERVARASAEAAALARDQFLAIVSHELRSPLNGIKSWTHVLENHIQGDADPTLQRAIAGILIGVEQQVRLIDDLLDVTRALSGNLGLAKEPMALAPALFEAIEGLRAVAVEKDVTLIADDAFIEAEIHGDFGRVHQIFANLVGNALKFTPPGGTVRVSSVIEGNMARIDVSDDGAGIPPDFLPFVFDPFRQAEQASAIHRHQKGLGLGLALVQRLAELHGGHVTCESKGAGHGATFRVYLPLRRDDPASSAISAAPRAGGSQGLPSLAGIKVMVVDDQREHRESLGALLRQAGASVVLAASGQEALDRQDGADDADVIVCDIAMPTVDGYATLHQIRALEKARGAPRCPAIAVSAFSERRDRARALSAGFQMHLAKPVVPAELVLVIATVARGMHGM